MDVYVLLVLWYFIVIYQYECDWYKVIEYVCWFEVMMGEDEFVMVVQFYCELVEWLCQYGVCMEVVDYLKCVFECQFDCVCVFMFIGCMYVEYGEYVEVIVVYEVVVVVDIVFVLEIFLLLFNSYVCIQQMECVECFLQDIFVCYYGILLVLVLMCLYQQCDGEWVVVDFFIGQLCQCFLVCGLMVLIDVIMDKIQGEVRDNFLILCDFIKKLLEGQVMYCCSCCGFGVKVYYWQCFSCKSWSMICLIYGVVNEQYGVEFVRVGFVDFFVVVFVVGIVCVGSYWLCVLVWYVGLVWLVLFVQYFDVVWWWDWYCCGGVGVVVGVFVSVVCVVVDY